MARLVDADALYESLRESAQSAKEWREEAQDEEIKIRAESAYFTFCECAMRIESAPTITAEPKHGRWIDAREQCGDFVCSKCEYQSRSEYNFCPNCGAEMKNKEKKNND